jgi:adenylate kinase
MNLIILGLPAAGKGTQAKNISEEYNLVHIATGDILRRAVTDSRQGKVIRKYLDTGKLIPDEMIIEIVKEHLLEIGTSGIIFDGFPRNLKQAEALEEIFKEMGKRLDLVLYMEVKEAEIIRRISGRRVCQNCGESYHLDYRPPRKAGICDQCGGKLIQRSDDDEEIVRKRIKLHSQLLAQLITYYDEKGILQSVDSHGKIEEVFDRLKRVIEVNLL